MLKNNKVCGNCRAYALSDKNCTLGYDTEYKRIGGIGSTIIDSIPTERCPKPLTIAEYMEAVKFYKKRGKTLAPGKWPTDNQ